VRECASLPTDEIACWWEETKISTQLRLAAGVCVLTTGLLIGSAGGAIASADESADTTTQSQDVETTAATTATTVAPAGSTGTTLKSPVSRAIQDVLKKLHALSRPVQKPIIIKSVPETIVPDPDADKPASEDVAPAATDAGAPDPNVFAAGSDSTAPGTNFTASGPAQPGSPTGVVEPALKAVQPVTEAMAKVAGVALTVPGVLAALPNSETPVADVITSVQNMLISVNDAVAPIAQVPGDLYSLLVVAGMGGTTVGPVDVGSGLGLSALAGMRPAAPTPPAALPILPVSPIPGLPLVGDVVAPATLGGIAAVGLSADLSLAGTAPLATEVAAPTSPLSFLEHTVRAVLAPASLTALAALALPGIGGLLIICAAGMRLGYRQAKAALAVRSTAISRFARQGPLGVVRSGALVSLHTRHPRRVRAVRPEVARSASRFEQAA
jgi:hypothetical protein